MFLALILGFITTVHKLFLYYYNRMPHIVSSKLSQIIVCPLWCTHRYKHFRYNTCENVYKDMATYCDLCCKSWQQHISLTIAKNSCSETLVRDPNATSIGKPPLVGSTLHITPTENIKTSVVGVGYANFFSVSPPSKLLEQLHITWIERGM